VESNLKLFSWDRKNTSIIPVEIETLCSKIEELCLEKMDQITANIYKEKFQNRTWE
jgi:hypothetical protein